MKEEFNIHPVIPPALAQDQALVGSWRSEYTPNTFGTMLYEELHRSPELLSYTIVGSNETAELWKAGVHESDPTKTKTEMAINLLPIAPSTTTYSAFSKIPRRVWGSRDQAPYTSFRHSIKEMLYNKVRTLELSQICWGGIETNGMANHLISIKDYVDAGFATDNVVIAAGAPIVAPTAENALVMAIAGYMEGSGRYPKQLVLNQAAIQLLGTNYVDVASAALNNLYKVQVSFIPDFTATNTTPKIVMGDFSNYYMFEVQNDGQFDISLENKVKTTSVDLNTTADLNVEAESPVSPTRVPHFNVYQELDTNEIHVEIEDITCGHIMQGQSFLYAEFQIGAPSNPFIVDISLIDSLDTVG